VLHLTRGVLAFSVAVGVSDAHTGSRRRPVMRTVTPPEHREGIVARTIESQTAKLPSDLFLWMAGISILGSLTLKVMGRDKDALFVGQWPAPFMLLGIYNKLVKLLGSD
jgi:hypothetical protein